MALEVRTDDRKAKGDPEGLLEKQRTSIEELNDSLELTRKSRHSSPNRVVVLVLSSVVVDPSVVYPNNASR